MLGYYSTMLLASGLNDCCWFICTVDTVNIVSVNTVMCLLQDTSVVDCIENVIGIDLF